MTDFLHIPHTHSHDTEQAVIDTYLLFTIGNHLHEISLDTSHIHLIDFIINIPNFDSATSIEVDILTDEIYWADSLESKIFKASRAGGTRETIIGLK